MTDLPLSWRDKVVRSLGVDRVHMRSEKIHKLPRDAISNENTFLNIHEYTSETTELLNYSLKATLSIWSNQISLITCGVNASFAKFKLSNHQGTEKSLTASNFFRSKISFFVD